MTKNPENQRKAKTKPLSKNPLESKIKKEPLLNEKTIYQVEKGKNFLNAIEKEIE